MKLASSNPPNAKENILETHAWRLVSSNLPNGQENRRENKTMNATAPLNRCKSEKRLQRFKVPRLKSSKDSKRRHPDFDASSLQASIRNGSTARRLQSVKTSSLTRLQRFEARRHEGLKMSSSLQGLDVPRLQESRFQASKRQGFRFQGSRAPEL